MGIWGGGGGGWRWPRRSGVSWGLLFVRREAAEARELVDGAWEWEGDL